jgi:hypothetical protein
MIEALLDLQFAEPERAKMFDCSSCIANVKKIRRCEEDKEFTSDDGHIWPMRVFEGGSLFGFCPGKAQRHVEAAAIYKALIVCAETGTHLGTGGIIDQPSWWIDLVSWFLPRYNEQRFYARAKAILGDSKAVNNGNIKRQLGSKNNRRK